MKVLKVDTDRKYEIIIEKNVLDECGKYIKKISNADRIAIITDSNVGPIYGKRVLDSITKAGYEADIFTFKAGESSKKLDTIAQMYDFLAENNITRKDLVVALGGGVCGDMAGFAAATYLRGIEFVQIPTSLLAQVDSSVGGKTGVDISFGKNLVGAFWQPSLVLIDTETLKTLPPHFINDGMAEIIKYGCIKDKEFFTKLENENAMDCIEDIIYTCDSIKRDVVNRDATEKGERILLNFGHTLGHSLEKTYNFCGLSHGEAVAVGMVMITKASEKAGLTEKGTADRIEKLCKKYNLPTGDKVSYKELAKNCAGDKKSGGDSIKLVLLKSIGTSFTQSTPLNEIESFITI